MSITSFITRYLFKRSDDKRDAGLSTPEDIVRFDDLSYGPDPRENVLDIYRPKDTEGLLPVIVSVHGGGWVYGDKERYQYYCMSLAQHGFAVVNYTYRLAPKHKFPSTLEDTVRVFSFVQSHAEKYGLDTGNIFALGDSAGAQLLSQYCCLCTNEDFASKFPFAAPEGSLPKAVALNCGVYFVEKKEKADFSTRLFQDLLPRKGTGEELALLNVSGLVTPCFPPAFVMTAEGDFLASQAEPFVTILNGLGVEAEYHYYGDPEHVLGHVFHCDIRSPFAKRCNKDECDFFRRHMEEGV